MTEHDKAGNSARIDTLLAHAGRHPRDNNGFVNTAVYHGSTVTFPDVETMQSGRQKYHYGRRGNPTSDTLCEALSAIDGAAGTVLCPSGLNAISTALLSVLSSGDHLLMTDSAYEPGRNFAASVLSRMGIETSYYDPRIGAGIEALIRPNTRAILTESPGSLTFEIQDIPAIVAVARKHDIFTLIDNTWATPVFFRPLDLGVDIAYMASTKYVVGHSDVMMGNVAANERAWPLLKAFHGDSGLCSGPDDIYLATRGLRTMAVRLERHFASALRIASWLEGRPEIERVLYPALPSHPDHALWKRDFKGASGLFSFVPKTRSAAAVRAMLNGLSYFGLGYSWGGFESLAVLSNLSTARTATPWPKEALLIRLHIGLENPDDLIADLDAGLARLRAAE